MRATLFPVLVFATGLAWGETQAPPSLPPSVPPEGSAPETPPAPPPPILAPAPPSPSEVPAADRIWLDRTHDVLYSMVWHSALHADRLFGANAVDTAYERASGSIAPAILYDQFDGVQTRLRFRVDLPLPQLNERYAAFIGKVNRDEFVTERDEQSGAFQRQYGPASDEQTLLGIAYRQPRVQGSRFDADAGIRLDVPPDPFVKGGYVYERGSSVEGLLSLRETLFWQSSEGAGVTSRIDLERLFLEHWLVRWTNSATFSHKSQGVAGYSSLYAVRGFPNRRALAFAVGLDGSSDAPVSLHEYGVKAAWRQSVIRDWLVLEVRTSLTWPKVDVTKPREPSYGVGLGFEMFFGTDEFLARPVTF